MRTFLTKIFFNSWKQWREFPSCSTLLDCMRQNIFRLTVFHYNIVDFDALIMCLSVCLFHPLRAYTPQGYKTPTVEKARPVRAATTTPTSAQLCSIPLSSSAPKALYGKSRQTAWMNDDTGPSSSNTTSNSDSSSKKYVIERMLQLNPRDSFCSWSITGFKI